MEKRIRLPLDIGMDIDRLLARLLQRRCKLDQSDERTQEEQYHNSSNT